MKLISKYFQNFLTFNFGKSENARIKPRSWRSIFPQNFEFRATRCGSAPFLYLRTLLNNNTSESLKVSQQTPVLTECCVISQKKKLFFLVVTGCVWYHYIFWTNFFSDFVVILNDSYKIFYFDKFFFVNFILNTRRCFFEGFPLKLGCYKVNGADFTLQQHIFVA